GAPQRARRLDGRAGRRGLDERPRGDELGGRHAAHVPPPPQRRARRAPASAHAGTSWEAAPQRTCRRYGGFEPDIRHRTNDATVSLVLVARGLAVALLPELVVPGRHPGVAVRDIAEGPVSRAIFAVTRASDASRPS